MDLTRFRKICGMLGSEHDGERANAARLATAFLKQNGASWEAVGIGAAAPSQQRNDHYLSKYWEMMTREERARNKRLSSEVDRLKRQVKTLELKLAERETGVPVAEQRKREKDFKKARKEEKLRERQAAAERVTYEDR